MKHSDIVRGLQERLKELGYYSGFLDGQLGPLTSAAVIAFKQANGLKARDYVGQVTLDRLFDDAAKAKPEPQPVVGEAAWITEARSLIGTRETPGSRNTPEIMRWAEDLDQWYPGDDVPWCGLFVAHCMAQGAPDEPQAFNRLGARAWMNFGVEVPAWYGAIAVFWRTHKTNSWNGHVGFLVGEDATTYHILGGNQSDSVNITRVSKSRLLGFRGPSGWTGKSSLGAVTTGRISTNEA